jgi:hypothetical protein
MSNCASLIGPDKNFVLWRIGGINGPFCESGMYLKPESVN